MIRYLRSECSQLKSVRRNNNMRTATSVDYLTHKTDRIAVDTKLENSNRKSNPQSRYKMIFNLDEYEPMADKRVLMMPRNDTKSDNVLGPDDILPRSELVDSHLLHFLCARYNQPVPVPVPVLQSPTLAPPNNFAYAETVGVDEADRREYVQHMLAIKRVIRKYDTGKKAGANDRSLLQLLGIIEIEDLDESSRSLTKDLKTGRPTTFRRKETKLVLSDNDFDVPQSCPICLGGCPFRRCFGCATIMPDLSWWIRVNMTEMTGIGS